MKIKYKLNRNGWIKTDCKRDNYIGVGSIQCSHCDYFKKRNKMKQYVICEYKESK